VPIIVMICFARSGGTILNQCLGSLPNVVLISELNPLPRYKSKGNIALGTIKDQAKNWYGIDLKSNGFVESALELEDICQRSGRQLIIRDWTYGGFLPFGRNPSTPSDKLLTLEALQGECDIIPFCFVRDAIDVWLSLRVLTHIEIETFFAQYLKYVEAIRERNIQIFRYEDFVKRPEDTIYQICRYTGLEFSDSWKNYTSYDKVMGDTVIDPHSRGRKSGTIKMIPRRCLPKKRIIKLNRCKEMIRANELLGYPTSYDDVERESVLSAISERCSRFICRYPRGLFRIFRRLRRWSGRRKTLYTMDSHSTSATNAD